LQIGALIRVKHAAIVLGAPKYSPTGNFATLAAILRALDL
jgi:hypothetical protein